MGGGKKEKEPANINIKVYSHFCGLQIFSRAGLRGQKRLWEGKGEEVAFCFLWETMGQTCPRQSYGGSRWRVLYHWAAQVFSGKPEVSLAQPRQPPAPADQRCVEAARAWALPQLRVWSQTSSTGPQPKHWRVGGVGGGRREAS